MEDKREDELTFGESVGDADPTEDEFGETRTRTDMDEQLDEPSLGDKVRDGYNDIKDDLTN